MNRQYFEIDGYWKDDNTEFEGYIVTNFDDAEVDEEGNEVDDNVFFYGLDEEEIKQAIEDGENTGLEFVITDYRKCE